MNKEIEEEIKHQSQHVNLEEEKFEEEEKDIENFNDDVDIITANQQRRKTFEIRDVKENQNFNDIDIITANLHKK